MNTIRPNIEEEHHHGRRQHRPRHHQQADRRHGEVDGGEEVRPDRKPPIVAPCYMGIDMATREELIAAHKTMRRGRGGEVILHRLPRVHKPRWAGPGDRRPQKRSAWAASPGFIQSRSPGRSAASPRRGSPSSSTNEGSVPERAG